MKPEAFDEHIGFDVDSTTTHIRDMRVEPLPADRTDYVDTSSFLHVQECRSCGAERLAVREDHRLGAEKKVVEIRGGSLLPIIPGLILESAEEEAATKQQQTRNMLPPCCRSGISRRFC